MAILDLLARALTPVSKRMAASKLPGFVSRQVTTAERYFLDLTPDRRRGITVACGGCEVVGRNYAVDRGKFPFLCVEFVSAGRGTVTLLDREIPLAAGSVFAYGPGVPHLIRTDPRRPLRKYYVDFVGRDAAAMMRAAGLPPGSHVTASQPRDIQGIFDLLQHSGLAHSPASGRLCAQLLGVLFTKIAACRLPGPAVDHKAFATFARFKKLLTDGRRRFTSVEAAATECGISAAYACRLFRRFDAISPYHYLVRQRMSLAADLLTHERLQVKEAAARLGFADQYQFSRTFKRVYGLAPAAFQRHGLARRDS
ncbi:MAG: AraC family transcriptional regulator [Planctomycetia bacterium]|nr:AraC family transcriptional regulator [Planctomycetia bacterium]